MKHPKPSLWDLMSPNPDQLLAEALEKTDEEVAESLIARGYDLEKLDAELIGIVNRLPPKRSKRGFVAAGFAATLAAFCICVYVAASTPLVATKTPPRPTATSSCDGRTQQVDGGQTTGEKEKPTWARSK